MGTHTKAFEVSGWIFGAAVFIVGILNLILVHPVPGLVYLVLALVYLPPANKILQKKLRLSIPLLVKIALGVIIFFFTLGVSDLGDMIDKALRH
jgi:hypothetical protein